jgi:hypothetical protein
MRWLLPPQFCRYDVDSAPRAAATAKEAQTTNASFALQINTLQVTNQPSFCITSEIRIRGFERTFYG